MQLLNLINVADPSITMILSGINDDGSEVGYDFRNKIWLENNLFSTDRLISVGNFKKLKMYEGIKHNRIEDFSTFGPQGIEIFEGIDFYHGTLLKVKIFKSTGKSTIMKAIDARVEKLAEKRMKTMKPKMKIVYRNKPRNKNNKPKGDDN